MKTLPVLLGEQGALFGVATLPDESTRTTGVLILNAGLLHHVGPFRLHVDLAADLADLGFAVLRIDQSGKGESGKRVIGSRIDALIADYRDCLAEFQRRNVSKVVLVGLCSGADDALFIAERESSVAGIVMLDGYARKNWRYAFEHFRSRVLSAHSWRGLLTRIFTRPDETAQDGGDDESIDIREWGSATQMQSIFGSLIERETRLLAIFTAGQDYYNRLGQLAAGLGQPRSTALLEEVYYPDADHTYSAPSHRQRLIRMIRDWMTRNY